MNLEQWIEKNAFSCDVSVFGKSKSIRVDSLRQFMADKVVVSRECALAAAALMERECDSKFAGEIREALGAK